MKLVYYKSDHGNFGDDLNLWLWPKIFGSDFFNKRNDIAFMGIGSILMGNSKFIDLANESDKKVIFSTGVRSINENFNFDESWDIRFVRGPYSALRLTKEANNYIADGAYFFALLPEYEEYLKLPKKHKISFIPYFKSLDKVDWKSICDTLGWNLILPTNNDVEQFMKDIVQSEQVISEAMHGSILADALRVPWKRLRFNAHMYEGERVSEWKWNDWMLSIDITENDFIEAPVLRRKKWFKISKSAYRKANEKHVIEKLKHHENTPFMLSTDEVMKTMISKMKTEVEAFKSKYF
ncbi:polysaccharide pyruvyl transferase family protein [uncultured Lacinutrix sp.]|uniref:polysaccharide pyruvyl transferase family protein n=1 Tax=uncultured Lacinutrix sp. TaxID=574032 RepID=UPI00262921B4|nr:polysaccharide pyruvyl transferase family protein [uncultured Lacinutrix sp.]